MRTAKNILTTLALLFGAATLSTAPAWGQGATAPAPKETKKAPPATGDSLAPAVQPGSLEITVHDRCGRPVPGRSVEAQPALGSPELASAATDAKGAARLEGLRPGQWRIAVYDDGGNFVWQMVEIKSGQHTSVIVTLPIDIGDINHDDAVNSSDFFDFIQAWTSAEPLGDFNRNGLIDSQDFYDFLAVFLNGCPPIVALLDDSVE